MRNLLLIFFLISSTAINAQTGEKNFIDQNYIEVTGKADMEITPDEIFIKILINEKDFKNKDIEEIEQTMFDKLTELELDLSKDLAIKDLISNFQYYLFIKTDIKLIKEYQLTVHDAKTASKVFLELQNIGISNVSIDKVENSNINKYRKEVKIAAIKAAKEKAEALAQAIDQDIGRAIYIQEIESIFNMTGNALQGKAAGIMIRGTSNKPVYGSRESEPEIEFEKIKLEYNIIARFELK